MRPGEGRLDVFCDSLESPMPDVLRSIENEAVRDGVPVIRRGTRRALRMLLALRKPKTVLEIGTAVGFSAVYMYLEGGAPVTTIENRPERIREARRNIVRAGAEGGVRLLEGDARTILPQLDGPYDLIFLDAAKGQYITLLPELLRLLSGDGVLAADNILEGGETLDSRFAVERRNRTIHARIRAYLEAVYANPELTTTILPVGDGLAVSCRAEGRDSLRGEEDETS